MLVRHCKAARGDDPKHGVSELYRSMHGVRLDMHREIEDWFQLERPSDTHDIEAVLRRLHDRSSEIGQKARRPPQASIGCSGIVTTVQPYRTRI